LEFPGRKYQIIFDRSSHHFVSRFSTQFLPIIMNVADGRVPVLNPSATLAGFFLVPMYLFGAID